MSEDKKWLVTFRNQIIGIIAAAIMAGLWMNYKFMSTIELVMQNFKENTEIRFDNTDKRFDGVERRIDKVEDKTDEIRRFTVPTKDQVQEDRKKDPRF